MLYIAITFTLNLSKLAKRCRYIPVLFVEGTSQAAMPERSNFNYAKQTNGDMYTCNLQVSIFTIKKK